MSRSHVRSQRLCRGIPAQAVGQIDQVSSASGSAAKPAAMPASRAALRQ